MDPYGCGIGPLPGLEWTFTGAVCVGPRQLRIAGTSCSWENLIARRSMGNATFASASVSLSTHVILSNIRSSDRLSGEAHPGIATSSASQRSCRSPSARPRGRARSRTSHPPVGLGGVLHESEWRREPPGHAARQRHDLPWSPHSLSISCSSRSLRSPRTPGGTESSQRLHAVTIGMAP